MRRFIRVGIQSNSKFAAEVSEKFYGSFPKELSKYAIKTPYDVWLPYYPEDPKLKEVLEYVEGRDYNLLSEILYTKKELQNIEFFEMDIPEIGEKYPLMYDKSQYEYECPICQKGERLKGPFIYNKNCLKHHDIFRFGPIIGVSERVRTLIENYGLTGISSFVDIEDYLNRDTPNIFQACIDSVLPPLSDYMWFAHGHYLMDKCGHEKTKYYCRSELQYEKKKLIKAQDFNITCEMLSQYEIPYLVVSKKVRDFCVENKIKAKFKPILLIDSDTAGVYPSPYISPSPADLIETDTDKRHSRIYFAHGKEWYEKYIQS